APSDTRTPLVVAAGRLVPVKHYGVLIDAFARVAEARPDWRLRIYGGGPEKERLRRRIEKHDLYNHVYLMGPHAPLIPELVKGSIAVSTSSREAFGMSIVEAMRCGLPVVSTRCPLGPPEIIHDGTDGLLAPPGNAPAVADALLTLIDNDALRRKMGQAAAETGAGYDPHVIADRVDQLLHELATAHTKPARHARHLNQRCLDVAFKALYAGQELRRATARRLRPASPR
ncbi:glycosyltransferase family 4 protein, partial [Streptomyces sp. A7024]